MSVPKREDVEAVRDTVTGLRRITLRTLAQAQAEGYDARAARITARVEILDEVLDFLDARADLAELHHLPGAGDRYDPFVAGGGLAFAPFPPVPA